MLLRNVALAGAWDLFGDQASLVGRSLACCCLRLGRLRRVEGGEESGLALLGSCPLAARAQLGRYVYFYGAREG